jgi:hypothetical protein
LLRQIADARCEEAARSRERRDKPCVLTNKSRRE